MWQSTGSGLAPDVKFLRNAGVALAVLAFCAGTVSLIGVSASPNEPRLTIAPARTLQAGATAMFRTVDENIARRHEGNVDITIEEVVEADVSPVCSPESPIAVAATAEECSEP